MRANFLSPIKSYFEQLVEYADSLDNIILNQVEEIEQDQGYQLGYIHDESDLDKLVRDLTQTVFRLYDDSYVDDEVVNREQFIDRMEQIVDKLTEVSEVYTEFVSGPFVKSKPQSEAERLVNRGDQNLDKMFDLTDSIMSGVYR